MKQALTKEFLLVDEYRWDTAKRFLESNYAAFAENENPLRIIVTSAEAKRNALQNRRYWKAVLEPISEQVWVEGRQYDKDTWHEYYARRFGYFEEMQLPKGGTPVLRRRSTTEYTVSEFADYMSHVEADAAQEFGVKFPYYEG